MEKHSFRFGQNWEQKGRIGMNWAEFRIGHSRRLAAINLPPGGNVAATWRRLRGLAVRDKVEIRNRGTAE